MRDHVLHIFKDFGLVVKMFTKSYSPISGQESLMDLDCFRTIIIFFPTVLVTEISVGNGPNDTKPILYHKKSFLTGFFNFLGFLTIYGHFLFQKNVNQLLIFSPFAKNHRRMLPQAMTQLKYAKIRHAVMDILMLNLVEKLMTHHF